jgi:hypothetical protein
MSIIPITDRQPGRAGLERLPAAITCVAFSEN